MPLTCACITDTFPELITATSGDLGRCVMRVASVENAGPDCLVFASTPEQFQAALTEKAGAVVLKASLASSIPPGCETPILLTPKPSLAMAKILQRFFDPSREKFLDQGVDPRAFVDASARIGEGAVICAGVFVGPRVEIGAQAKVGPGCVLEEGAKVGPHTVLHALVFLGRNCEIGAHCEIHSHTTLGGDGYSYAQDALGHHHKIPQLGNVVIEDHVEIGSNCAIDRAAFDVTRIGTGTKLDNLCHIAHNCQIGKHVLLTGGFFVAGSSSIGDHFVCGGRATVTDHVTICPGVQLGGLSAVTKDIEAPGAYGGYPLQPMKQFLRTTSSLAYLPDMRKALAALEKRFPPAPEG
jgi:UDP-3-O-[3-hydroxymyristoyl] glucosamine N-acyltransferase